jgi:hypothetical protein
MKTKQKWGEVDRGTKCFSGFHGSDCDGAFPKGFFKWVATKGWLVGEASGRCHLCAGLIDDPGSFKVDIRPEVKPDLVADATNTGLEDDRFDCVVIDPPYSKDLAQKLYGTGDNFYSINPFLKEGIRIAKPGGLIMTLSYETPKTPKGADLVACWGVYTCPMTSYMRCFTVWRKR